MLRIRPGPVIVVADTTVAARRVFRPSARLNDIVASGASNASEPQTTAARPLTFLREFSAQRVSWATKRLSRFVTVDCGGGEIQAGGS